MLHSTRKQIAIIDIDDTISDASHRVKLIEGKDKNWDLFFNLAHFDPPREDNIFHIKNILDEISQNTGKSIMPVFSTGRSIKIKNDTKDFLKKYYLHTINELTDGFLTKRYEKYELYMREEEEHDSATEIKRILLKQLIEEYCIRAVFDDNDEVLKMYKEDLANYPGVGIYDAKNLES